MSEDNSSLRRAQNKTLKKTAKERLALRAAEITESRRNQEEESNARWIADRPAYRKQAHQKLSPLAIDQMAEALMFGFQEPDALRIAGLDPSLAYSWREVAASDRDDEYACLARKAVHVLEKGRVHGKYLLMRQIYEFATGKTKSGNWTAAAWLLERRYQDEFALVQRTQNQTLMVQANAKEAIEHAERYLATAPPLPAVDAEPLPSPPDQIEVSPPSLPPPG